MCTLRHVWIHTTFKIWEAPALSAQSGPSLAHPTVQHLEADFLSQHNPLGFTKWWDISTVALFCCCIVFLCRDVTQCID